MEKHTPHSKLHIVKQMIDAGCVRSTRTALRDAAALGMDFNDMIDVVQLLTPKDFHKSMTTYNDHKVWQDVYKTNTTHGEVYLKITVIDDVLIVSFKEL